MRCLLDLSWVQSPCMITNIIFDFPKKWQLTVFNKQPKKKIPIGKRVNNLSQDPNVLGLIREKFNEAQLAAFRASCFGLLEHGNELAFSGQLEQHPPSFCLLCNKQVPYHQTITIRVGFKKPKIEKNQKPNRTERKNRTELKKPNRTELFWFSSVLMV
ncbi:hypothetical protein DVH24_000228 [Malus domestica]|uniref:Uncharacterized protein n=1 Tax=Malus domestica TaxID=3750 RepID=A0A498IYZ3_MALDO|nr:hypothetical protein DVH24_000228 [Malus domestica]